MVTSNHISSNCAPRDDNNILHRANSTKLVVNRQELGTGTLFITKSNIVWSNAITTGVPHKLSLLYPTISFHGIQRTPTPTLCMVVNFELRSVLPDLNPNSANSDDNEDNFDEETPITELRFIPQNINDLEAMNAALNEGQRLHPDPADEVSDDDEGIVDIFEDTESSDDVTFGVIHRVQHLGLNEDERYIEDYYEDNDEDRG